MLFGEFDDGELSMEDDPAILSAILFCFSADTSRGSENIIVISGFVYSYTKGFNSSAKTIIERNVNKNIAIEYLMYFISEPFVDHQQQVLVAQCFLIE